MRERIFDLSRLRMAAHPVQETPLDQSSAQAVCTELASHVVAGKLEAFIVPADPASGSSSSTRAPDAEYSLQLARGQPAVHFRKEETGGSCGSDSIFATKSDGSRVQNEIDDDDDSGLGTRDELIYYGQRYFVVTAGSQAGKLVVKSISPQGRLSLLCDLTPSDSRRVVIRATAPAVCSAAIAGKLPSVSWSAVAMDSLTPNLPRGLPGGSPDSAEVAQVDLAGDGTTQRVLRYHVSSGAGCGSSTTVLAVISPDMKIENTAIAKRLDSIRSDDTADIVQSGKHAYVLGSLTGESTLALLDLTVDPPHEVCNFVNKTAYIVKHVYTQ